jgi:arylsulfatase A-like enzyme
MVGLPWEAADVDDDDLPDGATAARAIEVLGEVKDRPFFLAVGFLRPHLPFVAPKKYWDLYPQESIRLAANPQPPRDVPSCALYEWSELRAFGGIIPASGPLSDDVARQAIRGYRAATSYLDAQVGRVLDELDRLKLREKTVIVFWGDHGWQLGEHGIWCKHTNFEVATRAPLIVSFPGQKSAGRATNAFVEFVDIYPTLVELCGLPQPKHLDGKSFVPLFEDPSRAWKPAAFSQYSRKVPGIGTAMGHSVRTERYRYTEWKVPEKGIIGHELYDHRTDPDENVNLADQPEQAATLQELSALLTSIRHERSVE